MSRPLRMAFKTTEEVEWELGILTRWKPYLEGAGIYDPAMNAATVYLLAGEIMHDEVVKQRHTALMRDWRPTEKQRLAPSRNFYLGVLYQMTPQEKDELRQRINKRYSGKRP